MISWRVLMAGINVQIIVASTIVIYNDHSLRSQTFRSHSDYDHAQRSRQEMRKWTNNCSDECSLTEDMRLEYKMLCLI